MTCVHFLWNNPELEQAQMYVGQTISRSYLIHIKNVLIKDKSMTSFIRTPMLIQGTLERTEINVTHFKWGSMWIFIS